MGLRDLARKSLGLLVELPEEERPQHAAPQSTSEGGDVQSLRKKSIGELLNELDGSPGGQPVAPVQFNGAPESAIQGGEVDVQAIFKGAGVSSLAFGAEQTRELIHSLPSDLPLATKRQMVEASLNTMGRAMNISKEQVLLDATQKIQALAAYEDAARQQRDTAVNAMQQRVKELEAQIDAERQRAAESEKQFQSVLKQCEAAGDALDEVQEFLTLDEGPSRMTSGSGAVQGA